MCQASGQPQQPKATGLTVSFVQQRLQLHPAALICAGAERSSSSGMTAGADKDEFAEGPGVPQQAGSRRSSTLCQVEGCGRVLTSLSIYHQRCHICEVISSLCPKRGQSTFFMSLLCRSSIIQVLSSSVRCIAAQVHIKMPAFQREGKLQRFCQRCGRCHEIERFEGSRRSCREQLAKHNAR